MKDFLDKINIATICLIALVVKLVAFGGNLPDSIAIVAICAFLAAKMYIDITKDNLLDKANEQIAKIAQEYQKLTTEISTIKMKMGMEQNTRKITGVEKQGQKPKQYF